MLKPTIGNVALSFLVKYPLFYAGNIVYQSSYQWLGLSALKSGQDVLYWLWMFGFLPVVSILLFAVPLSLILRLSRPVTFSCALAGFVVVDYAFYVFFTSQKLIDSHGFYHETVGLSVLAFLFHRRIRAIFTSVA
ncbi:hypothetical protein [Hymenobacter koreensis]|uniref:Uncharacterized protein n=1 Tax=Hymenobacter koreensis TaxID=1084523 RepID=A0ABP8JNH1_9BACT